MDGANVSRHALIVPKTPTTFPVTVTITTQDKDGNTISAVGGTATASPATVSKGDTITVTVTPNAGYELKEIVFGDGISVTGFHHGTDTSATVPDDFVPVTADHAVVIDVTFKALPTYTVKFNANGGSGTMADVTVTAGDKLTLPDCGFTPQDGKEFDKWDAGNPGDEVEVTADCTITAIWKDKTVTPPAPTTYTVTFKDGDSTLSTQTVNDGDKASKPADPTKDGYTFDGWYADNTFNAAFDFNTAITADTTVYAKFTKNTSEEPSDPGVTKFTISYDLNGGTLDGRTGIIKVQAEEGLTITIPAAPTREGYKFTYWKGSEYHPGDSYKVEGDHTFTAQWEKVSSSSEGTDSGSSGGSTSDDGKKDDASQTGTTNPTGTKTPVPNTGVRAPKTGDDSHMVLWGSLMAASLLGLFLVFVLRRRYREER